MTANSSHRPPADALVALAERVEQFCREFGRDDQLANLMEEAGAEDLLDQAVQQVGSDGYLPERMTGLLDAIERVGAEQGIHNLTRSNRAWTPLPGVRPRRAELTVRVCPVRRCTRSQGDNAICALTNRQLDALPLAP